MASACLATKKQYTSKLSVDEMRISKRMCGKTRRDRIRNENICEMIGVVPIEDKLRDL